VKPRVRIRQIAGEVVYDVHHGRRRVTWPTWAIAIAHANRLAIAEQRARALLRGRVG
jgi:hypothetical protein